ncbi:type IV toxin-antitoxin system AbiEi family antitoxin [Herbaspirillum huttiense]|uniref:Type IV toxin-antitoxin system AbiEi family antitoxin n=1 Tax=Herbaspirillum huttiense subsp. lycopersici TaxID=3074428 RepID=A0ABU2EP24_9BURK|nr:type IV toxin-antitoxin system AbiEi family antitoxin [Herbaspirillum huttiense]MDR9849582.1 type IV toxin-antitoxin system AbiEi family antitoxin [Herbaspirillum huttiense SE1]
MLKTHHSMKSFETQAAHALRSLLLQVPALKLLDIEHETAMADSGVDFTARIKVAGKRHALVCEANSSGQPRHVRHALLTLRDYMSHHAKDATPVLIAPYLSPDAQALCREHEAGFLDLEGNARLVFDGIFIERQVASKPVADRRALRSLFKPKSAQVLRVLLRDPQRAWRVMELAQAAAVSLGHVSNVRTALLEREWAQVAEGGLVLSEPDALLDEWQDAYAPPPGERLAFYTPLHGSAFEQAARHAMRRHREDELPAAAFSSFSAAQWLAPYARTGTHYFQATEAGLEALQSALKLSSAAKGENVMVNLLDDADLLRDTQEPAPGAVCTSPIQTYLDLHHAGERGREAADHLRKTLLTWKT